MPANGFLELPTQTEKRLNKRPMLPAYAARPPSGGQSTLGVTEALRRQVEVGNYAGLHLFSLACFQVTINGCSRL